MTAKKKLSSYQAKRRRGVVPHRYSEVYHAWLHEAKKGAGAGLDYERARHDAFLARL
jgi:hypothetical protein